MINMRSSSTSLIPSIQGAIVACTCLPINSIGRVRDYIGIQWTGTQPTNLGQLLVLIHCLLRLSNIDIRNNLLSLPKQPSVLTMLWLL